MLFMRAFQKTAPGGEPTIDGRQGTVKPSPTGSEPTGCAANPLSPEAIPAAERGPLGASPAGDPT